MNLLIVLPEGFAGIGGEISTNVDDPVEVANTWPFCNPTMRILSPRFQIAIVLIGEVPANGTWLTAVIVSPRSNERYNRSDPKYTVFGEPAPTPIGAYHKTAGV